MGLGKNELIEKGEKNKAKISALLLEKQLEKLSEIGIGMMNYVRKKNKQF